MYEHEYPDPRGKKPMPAAKRAFCIANQGREQEGKFSNI
jgi:hypothetical protein